MFKPIISLANILSAGACFVIGILLTLDFGFIVSVQNRALFSLIYFYLMLYFLFDILVRFLIVKKKKALLFARVLDILILFPLLGKLVPDLSLLNNYLFIQIVMLLVMVGRIPHIANVFKILRFDPAQIFLTGYVLTIFVGALLLSLPNATNGQAHISFVDALFTSTSAICVTGLITKDTGQFFSGFGQLVILGLIQLGGLGIMTFYAMVTLVLNRKFSKRESVQYQETLLTESTIETFSIIKAIFKFTILFELIGVVFLFIFWFRDFDSIANAFYYSVFHAISAFCNAGFSLFSDSLSGYSGNAGIILTVGILIVIGGIGFPVIFSLYKHDFLKHRFKMLKIQTKIPIVVSLFLIIIGMAAIFFGEYHHALAGMSFGKKMLMSFFHSVSARTAGFNAMDLQSYHLSTLWILIIWMFIGASPGSTGGGIKTTTFGLLIASLWSNIQGRDRVELFGRTITSEDIFRALSIIIIAAIIVVAFFYLLLTTERFSFIKIFFESISAFGTVGYSLGITPHLSKLGKIWVIFLMFIGRVGPLTFAFALARRKPKPNYAYPEERILLG